MATNRGALQQAKQNLEMRYSVVGVVEQFNASLAVLEEHLPGTNYTWVMTNYEIIQNGSEVQQICFPW